MMVIGDSVYSVFYSLLALRFCGKTVQGLSYATKTPGSDCKEGEKKCGGGDKFFCVNSTTLCPINYIGFSLPLSHGIPTW
jgi:hypothetical protein